MRINRIKSIIVLLIAALTVGVFSASAQQDDDGLLRFVHAIPGVGAVDVYIDGDLSVIDLGYGRTSNYIRAEAGVRQIIVRPAGLTTELWRQQVNADAETPKTLIASGIDPLEFAAFEDDLSAIEPGVSRLRIIHAIQGGPAVNITFEDQEVVSGLTYGGNSGGFDLQAERYLFNINVDGDEIATVDTTLISSTSQLMVIYGTPNAPQIVILTAPTTGAGDVGFVRVAHTADAPPVDLYADDVLIAARLGFGDVTEHLQLPAGAFEVELRQAGTAESLLSATLEIEAGVALTLAAMGSADDLVVNVFEDDLTALDGGTSVVSVINTIPDSEVSISLNDGTVLADALDFNSAGDAVAFDPTRGIGSLDFTLDGQSQQVALGQFDFYGGVYVNAFVVLDTSGPFPQPAVVFAQTALAQMTASAPGAARAVVAQDEEPPAEVVEEVEEVEEPEVIEEPEEVVEEVVEEPEEVVEEVTEVEEPQEVTEVTEASEVTQAPTPVPAQTGPTARIQLNPGANLNLRQYPNADAFVLGQAPSGTTLLINGREGAELDIDGELVDEDYVDPAELLEENQDLNQSETWLNVTYNTPDGGQITAWINAQFVLVRDERGNLGALRDLPTVPASQPGEAVNTSVQPPSATAPSVTVRIVNLNPGVNLNVRRTPEVAGEILFGIPLGTVTPLEGVDESREWGFIRFQPTQGGLVTGWINLQFADVQFNDRPITLEGLEELDRLVIIEETRRGEISADAPPAPAPTVDPTRNVYIATVQINPGANLNLRRNPNAQAEVLAQIPSQSQVFIDGRTADELWLQTNYEGAQGWIASAFVTVTFNGIAVNLEEIPVIETATPDTDEDDE
ncbi:MAG: DUF4397 domain-containing protein [Anaerolineaceae bacterium]|nr:MAG: DUF4397 domain-containing protein [Anaerolineaceae bacterium]